MGDIYYGPDSPLCVTIPSVGNGVYCLGDDDGQALGSMRAADRMCRLTRGPHECDWRPYAAPTQGASPLSADANLPKSQCLDPDYCAARGSLQPISPAFTPTETTDTYRLVNPTTTRQGVPRALHVTPSTGVCHVPLLAAQAALGQVGGFCAGVAPS
jgi:hypothetical protein